MHIYTIKTFTGKVHREIFEQDDGTIEHLIMKLIKLSIGQGKVITSSTYHFSEDKELKKYVHFSGADTIGNQHIVSLNSRIDRRDKLTGIYRLTFDDGAFYVGKSVDIFNRFITHVNNLTKFHVERVSKKFILYLGQSPRMEILEECSTEYLDKRERYWIDSLEAKKSLNTI